MFNFITNFPLVSVTTELIGWLKSRFLDIDNYKCLSVTIIAFLQQTGFLTANCCFKIQGKLERCLRVFLDRLGSIYYPTLTTLILSSLPFPCKTISEAYLLDQ